MFRQDSNFYMWELFVFAVIATLGGLIGALFVACNKRLDLFRARHLSGRWRRFAEVRKGTLAMLLRDSFFGKGKMNQGGPRKLRKMIDD